MRHVLFPKLDNVLFAPQNECSYRQPVLIRQCTDRLLCHLRHEEQAVCQEQYTLFRNRRGRTYLASFWDETWQQLRVVGPAAEWIGCHPNGHNLWSDVLPLFAGILFGRRLRAEPRTGFDCRDAARQWRRHLHRVGLRCQLRCALAIRSWRNLQCALRCAIRSWRRQLR